MNMCLDIPLTATCRIVAVWFFRLPSDRALRRRAVVGPFAVSLSRANTAHLYCVNRAAAQVGLRPGMTLSDARALCPDLLTEAGNPTEDTRFLNALARWAMRYCPLVGCDAHGIVMDITGSAHLIGGEAALLADMRRRFAHMGLSARIALADTRGAAWALAHYGEGVAAPGDVSALMDLPVAALRITAQDDITLQRMGLRRIADLEAAPRAPLARRFGPALLMRLDQLFGRQPEQISSVSEQPHFGTRMSFPDPIGLMRDLMAALERVLAPLCDKLARAEQGARVFHLVVRRVDKQAQTIELRLAAPMRDPARILPLFTRAVEGLDAGYGIDQIRLVAVQIAALPAVQITSAQGAGGAALDEMLTRIGTRIGLENILRFVPADSHIPERSFSLVPAAYTKPHTAWDALRPRPLRMFAPEKMSGCGGSSAPPARFLWRRMRLSTLTAQGPERISPEWWFDDPAWRSGLRDYWIVQTRQGRRLWIFHTPQDPAWFVHGEFP